MTKTTITCFTEQSYRSYQQKKTITFQPISIDCTFDTLAIRDLARSPRPSATVFRKRNRMGERESRRIAKEIGKALMPRSQEEVGCSTQRSDQPTGPHKTAVSERRHLMLWT